MTQLKPTKDVRQAWALGALVVSLIMLFAFVVLPYVDPGRQREREAPAFVLPVIYGGDAGSKLSLADLRGSVVLLDFWASWCAPCRKQMPILNQIAQAYADENVMVIGVNTDTEPRLALDFLRQQPVGYVSVFDEAGEVSAQYGVSKLPTLVLIDPGGKIVYSEARVLSERSITELVEAALGTAD